MVAALFAYAYLAPLDALDARAPAPGTVVLDSHGAVLQRDVGEGLRIPVALDEVAPIMVSATLATEDQRFYSHPGVDPLAVARAASAFPDERSGASTITQQLARRLYLDGDRPPLLRKAREALLALQLEARYSKDELLEAYLNDVYYGRGAYGIEAAARVYFGVSARNLDLASASFLAGLPQLPAIYSDPQHLDAARARQQVVLRRLVDDDHISEARAAFAAETPLALRALDAPPPAPHFVQMAHEELARLRPDLARQPGLIVETTLDLSLQREAERSVGYRLEQLAEHQAGNASVVVLEPSTGRVLALVGNADFLDEKSGQVNLALAARQPGSALKPLLYAAAFEHGYTPASMLLDVPTTFDTSTGPYTPRNYDHRFHGPVTLRVALASSLNVPAVRTLDDIGIDALLNVTHRFGLSSLEAAEAYGLSLTLGGGGVRLLDLTAAYGALANNGELMRPYIIQRVRDQSGQVLYERAPNAGDRATSEQHAFLLADILSDPVARIVGFGEVSALDNSLDAAVKTGTSSYFRDNWTLGFTPDRVVGVWVGNPDGRPMVNISGVDGAAPIWRDVMLAASDGLPQRSFEPPASLVRASVCTPTGLVPGASCPSPTIEWFVAGTQPQDVESYYVTDATGELRLAPPVEARAWALDAGVALTTTAGEAVGGGALVHIVRPGAGTVLWRSPELLRDEVMLRAAVPAGTRQVEFLVDGALVGVTNGDDARLIWALEDGTHELEVRAQLENGTTVGARTRYEVRSRS